MPDIDRGALNQALAEALETAGRADLAYEPWTTCPECVEDDIRQPENCPRCGAEMVRTPRAFCTDLNAVVTALTTLGLQWNKEGPWVTVRGWWSERQSDSTSAALATALVQAAVTVLTKKASDA